MGKLVIINGSPRAVKSNSKRYGEIFKGYWGDSAEEFNVISGRYREICMCVEKHRELLFIFPLYADGIPAVLLGFLKELEKSSYKHKPTVHAIINCGFLEPEQNNVAADMIGLFCEKNGYPLGMILCIGGGEAILDTPFAFMAKRKIKKMAAAIRKGQSYRLKTSMMLTKNMFIKASSKYWTEMGMKNGISREDMDTMEIEGKTNKE